MNVINLMIMELMNSVKFKQQLLYEIKGKQIFLPQKKGKQILIKDQLSLCTRDFFEKIK